MANTQVLQRDFSGGFAQDYPRDQMPPGKVWYMQDAIPSRGGVSVERRGGSTYFTGTLANLGDWAHAIQPDGSTWTAALVGIASVSGSARLLTSDSVGALTNRGALPLGGSGLAETRMENFNSKIIALNYGASSKPCSITSAYAMASLSGAVANCIDLCSHKDRLVIADATNRKIYFSAPLDETTWDLTYGWIGFQDYTAAVRSMNGMLLVFTPSFLYRVRGSTPPPARDMIVEPILHNPGVIYPRQVTATDDLAFWANDAGVWATDGSSVLDITEKCGVKNWWVAARNATFNSLSLGVYQNHVIVDYAGYLGYPDLTLVLDYRNYRAFAWRLESGGYTAGIYVRGASSFFAEDELFRMGNNATQRWEKISPCFVPVASNKAGPNGTVHNMDIQSPWYGVGHPGRKRMKNVYIGYELKDAASDNPTLTVERQLAPASANVSIGTLSEATEYVRTRLAVNRAAHGIIIRLLSAQPTSSAKVYSLELESHNLEHSRRG